MNPTFKSVKRLSEREYEVFLLLGDGLKSAAICMTLYRSRKTVNSHTLNASRKLGLKDSYSLRAFAARFLERIGRVAYDSLKEALKP